VKKHGSKLLLALVVALAATAGYVMAQAGSPTLQLSTDARWGDHLVDEEGRSLYLYVLDGDGTTACVDACANNWPPLTVEPGAEPALGEGLDPALVGTIERPDGTVQVTYGGHPLYTFRRDTEPGHTRGQRMGDQFFLVSAAGEAITEEVAAEVVTLPEEEMAAVMEAGRFVFTSNCAVCHGTEGQGGIGPRFAGNTAIADTNYVLTMVLNGFIDHGMPAWRDVLNDEQVAAVTTFIRNSWGNEHGVVLPADVAGAR